jgi:glycerol-3-phosphate acyltransferase PlsY
VLYLCIAFAIVVPYLICSVNPAIMITRLKSGKDIRELGSGNPGLTNTLRTQGKSAAVGVLLFDVFKAVLSIFLVYWFVLETMNPQLTDMYEEIDDVHFYYDFFTWLAALTAVLGHCFPLYYKLKGGKAVLVTISAIFVINWLVALIMLGLFIIIVAATRYVSLGSCVAGATCPVLMWFLNGGEIIDVIFASAIVLTVILKHHENIKRLARGNEKKLGKSERVRNG